MPLRNPAPEPTPSASRHLPVEVLRRYVAGALEPAEQHRVEAHTLDCAHCADILEGLEMQPTAVTDASLTNLRQRLGARVAELAAESEPAAAPAWAWRQLAAAAVLLFTLGAVAWFTLHRSYFTGNEAIDSRAVAVQTPALPARPQVLPSTVTVPEAASASPDVAMSQHLPVSNSASQLRTTRRSLPNKEVASAKNEVASADLRGLEQGEGDASGVSSTEVSEAKDSLATSAATVAAAPATPLPAGAIGVASKQSVARTARAKNQSAAPVAEATRLVQGRITDQTTGAGLPGVTVLVPGTQIGASTVQDGSFAIQVPPGTKQLAVSSIGYATKTQALRPTDSSLTLALAPDTKALSEVVVVRRDAPPTPMAVGAMPAGGYAGLKKYLRDSLDYPEKALEARLQGNVKLRFVVGVDGKIADIKVVKKLSEECDAEAIRLLQEGPAWFPAIQNGRRTARTVELTVPFKIEER